MRRVAAMGALVALLVGCASTGSNYSTLNMQQAKMVQAAVDGFSSHYSAGVWQPSQYASLDWEKYQWLAIADAALAAIAAGDLTADQRHAQSQYLQRAIDVVSQAISVHQLADGDFDNGTPASGTSGVSGTFWGEALSQIAVALKPQLPAGTLSAWTASLTRYADYLWSTQAGWFTNGNVVLREALVAYGAYELSGDGTYLSEYNAWRSFLFSPGGRWQGMGWRDVWKPDSTATGWFTESTTTVPNTPMSCANGVSPCDGFDANYTMAQLADVLWLYSQTKDADWQTVVLKEWAAIKGRVSAGTFDASNGSRKNIATEQFVPSIYEVLDEHNLPGADESAWQAWASAEGQTFATNAASADPGPNAFSAVGNAALGLLDSERTG